ncbi:MAG: alpha/beta hydrolase, partial [Thiomargarita sp.]|nr:alpha/beta hydrolase [Thiomargarita sp.]
KTLQAWYFKNNSQSPAPLIIYFGGNAEEVSSHFTDLEHFTGWSLLLVNYRGYGLSEGKPSEKVLFDDALLIYDKFAARTDIDAQKIVAFGRSLGTGIAVYLAAHRKLAGVILISPYDSVASIAQEVYPYAPISLLLNHPFRVINYANKIQIPMLALIAKNDHIIPPHHSFKLIDAWGGQVHKKVIENTDHNNIVNETEVWQQISLFLKLH